MHLQGLRHHPHTNYAALDIQHGGHFALIRDNALHGNITSELDDISEAPSFRKPMMTTADKTWIPRLLIIRIVSTMWNHDKVHGSVENVTLRSYLGHRQTPPTVARADSTPSTPSKTSHLKTCVSTANSSPPRRKANLTVKPFVENVHISSPGTNT